MNDLARNSYNDVIMKEGRRDHNSPMCAGVTWWNDVYVSFWVTSSELVEVM